MTCSNSKVGKERQIFSKKLIFNYSLSSSDPEHREHSTYSPGSNMKNVFVNLYPLIKMMTFDISFSIYFSKHMTVATKYFKAIAIRYFEFGGFQMKSSIPGD